MAPTFNKHCYNVIYNATYRCWCLKNYEFRQALLTSGQTAIKKALIANRLSHRLVARLQWVIDQSIAHGIFVPSGALDQIKGKPKTGKPAKNNWQLY